MADTAERALVARSLPALGWQIRTEAIPPADAGAQLQELERVVQAWRVPPGPAASEAAAAAHVVRHAAERLRRLAVAYGEWGAFDAAAYFDLTPAQCALTVDVTVRVTTVHVTFYADLLLPSFRRAAHFWATVYAPAQARGWGHLEDAEHMAVTLHPALVERRQAAVEVIQKSRRLLAGDIGFLAANGANEERLRWTLAERAANSANGSERWAAPTLTLTFDFPRPARQQPGRRRRLRRNRERTLLHFRRQAKSRRGKLP